MQMRHKMIIAYWLMKFLTDKSTLLMHEKEMPISTLQQGLESTCLMPQVAILSDQTTLSTITLTDY